MAEASRVEPAAEDGDSGRFPEPPPPRQRDSRSSVHYTWPSRSSERRAPKDASARTHAHAGRCRFAEEEACQLSALSICGSNVT